MNKQLFFLATLCCLFTGSIHAQTVNDALELQNFTRRFMSAYNAQDIAAIRNMYTDDAVRIDQQGKEMKGAETIANFYAEQFRKNNVTLLIRHLGMNWSDAEHAWVAKGDYTVYGNTIVYDIAIDYTGSYVNTMLKTNGVWKIARSVLTATDQSAIKATIQAIENEWAAAANARDVEAEVAFYADDAVSIEPYKPDMLVGIAAIRKRIEAEKNQKKEGETSFFETLEVFGNGNLVTEIGRITSKDRDGKVMYSGKYMAIWEKRNGRYVTIRDIYSSDAKP
jgi:ketosteroid isomerase-like protein